MGVNADETEDQATVEELGPPPRAQRTAWIVRLASMVLVVGGWELLGRRVSPIFLSYPTAIVDAGIAMTLSGELFDALGTSLRTLVVGFVSAAVIGVVLGLLIGRYRLVDAATDWLINALYAMPLVAIIPLVILWFGLGDAAKMFIVIILTVFPVLINTAAGVRNGVPQDHLAGGRTLHDDWVSPRHWPRNHWNGRRRILYRDHRPWRANRQVRQSV